MKTLLRIVAGLALLATSVMHSQSVLTKSLDISSTSEDRQEVTLTPALVASKGMVQLPNIPVIGDARGMDDQPLIDSWTDAPSGTVAGTNATSVMLLASNGNVVRGVNPIGGAAYWQTAPLCPPVNSSQQSDMWQINQHFGILSTGVIDGSTHKAYFVGTCSSDGSGSFGSITQRMFVLDDRTGNLLANVLVTGTSNGLSYATAPRKQRAGLLLWNYNGVKFVMVLAGSFTENGTNASGFLLGFDTYDNTFKVTLSTKAGGWLSGGKPTYDTKTGLIYVGLGNGPFDGVTKFGEAVMQIQFTPPTATSAASFNVLHAWAPFSDDDRTCSGVYAAAKVAGTNAATETVPGANMVMASDSGNCNAAWGDQDAHLSLTYAQSLGLLLTAGKDGISYLINTNAFPDTAVADFLNPAANCAKVSLFEAGWNLGINPCPLTAAALNQVYGGKTRHQHSPIVQYTSPSGKHYFLFFAENSPLQACVLGTDNKLHFVARGAEVASASVPSGMPGGFGVATDNNGQNGIAWYSIPLGDANRTVTNGYLAAYDLTHLEDPTPTVPTIWKSAPYVFSKFNQPIVYQGTVILPNYAGSVMEWQLAQ